MEFGRWGRAAALLSDGRVLVAGGGDETAWATAEVFDPVRGTWSRTGDLNVPRFGHSLTALADGRVLVSGFGPLEIYDPSSGEFRLLDLEPPGDAPSATRLLDGRVLLIGGNDLALLTPGQPNGHGSGPATARAVAFDPATERLRDAGELLEARSNHGAVLLEDGRVLVSGGAQDVHHDEPILLSAEIWDPSGEVFEATGSMREPRFGHTLTVAGDGSVLVVGTISEIAKTRAERYLPPRRTPRPISGLFVAPGPDREPVVSRSLGAEPESPFGPWDGRDVVLYDTQTMTATNLGRGFVGLGGAFSPDGSRLAWTAGPPDDLSEIWVIDLESGERELVAAGLALWWLDDETLYGRQQRASNDNQRLDVRSGVWSPADDIDPNRFPTATETARWRLEPADLDTDAAGSYPFWSREFVLVDRSGVLPPLRFEARDAVLSPDEALFVAATPEHPSGPVVDQGPHIEFGVSNIFEVDPTTGEATYVARAEASAPGWAFEASGQYVAWMDGFCAADEDAGRTVILDRASGELTSVEQRMWFELTPSGAFAVGAFGARDADRR